MSKVCLPTIGVGSPYSLFKQALLGGRHFYVQPKSRLPIDLSLCLVTNRSYAKEDAYFVEKVMQTVQGGVTCVQYSDPHVDLRTKFQTALSLREKLRACKVPLIINNHVDIAQEVQADGVHLGQRDLPYAEARELLGSRAIIGLTVDTWDDVLKAEDLDVDYLGVQIFPSVYTKPASVSIWGLEGLRKIREVSRHRIVTIGGINLHNLSHVYQELDIQRKRDGVAMVGELWRPHDSRAAAQKVIDLFQQWRDHASN